MRDREREKRKTLALGGIRTHDLQIMRRGLYCCATATVQKRFQAFVSIQRSYKDPAEDVIALISKCQLALDKGLTGTIYFSDQCELSFNVQSCG